MTDVPQNKIRLRIPSAKDTIEYGQYYFSSCSSILSHTDLREYLVICVLFLASKFIRRTIPQAEYWITNRHRWMHNIPTEVSKIE